MFNRIPSPKQSGGFAEWATCAGVQPLGCFDAAGTVTFTKQAKAWTPTNRPARASRTPDRVDETSAIALRRAWVDAASARKARHRHADVDRALEDEQMWYVRGV